MNIESIAVEARYVVSNLETDTQTVWDVFILPLSTRHKTWHPSFGDFEPVKKDKEGKIEEYEVCGSAGGRYPIRIERREDSIFHLRLWKGPSKNPPKDHKEQFIGSVYDFRISNGGKSPIVDIQHRQDWVKPTGILSRKPYKEDGPSNEVTWIFSRFPISGKLDYVRKCDPRIV